MTGMSKTDCALECTEDNCWVTQQPICGHPFLGALQPAMQLQPEIKRRRNIARMEIMQQVGADKAKAFETTGL